MEILNRGERRHRVLPVTFLLILLLALPARFAGQEQDEYAVKAAFLFNFTRFVEWPQANGSSPFGICILGDDPFEAIIDKLTQGKTAVGRTIQVRRIKSAADAKSCQIAFVSTAERSKAAMLVDAVRGTPVLTVGETQEFLHMGGMIALPMEAHHVNIVISTTVAQSANLKISAKLLTLAKIYKSDRNIARTP